MPSQRKTVAAQHQQATMRALYPEELREGRDIFGNFFPEAARNIVALANGVSYQALNKNGDAVTLIRPPDLNANIYIMNRMLGVPQAEPSDILDRLNTARAVFMEEQVLKGLVEAQVRETLSRANIKEIEAEQWPKQFVTEEKQQQKIQELATAILAGLMALTPEEYEANNLAHPGDPSAALEALKGKIGVELADIVESVLGKDGDEDEGDEEEDE